CRRTDCSLAIGPPRFADGVAGQESGLRHALVPMNPQSDASVSAVTEKSFTPLVRQFLDYLKLERHFSDYTVKSYGADLIQFGQFMSHAIGHGPNNSAPVGDREL